MTESLYILMLFHTQIYFSSVVHNENFKISMNFLFINKKTYTANLQNSSSKAT